MFVIGIEGEKARNNSHFSPDVNRTPDRRPVKTVAKIISGRTEVLFTPGIGEPIRAGNRHLLNVSFHNRSHLFNADRVGETEAEYRARREFFQPALPTPWKHGDGKCKMIQHKSEDHRPTRWIFNELATYLEQRGADWSVLGAWRASQQGRFDSFGQELPEPAWHREDEPEPVYQFQCLKPQGHWKTQEPTWGSGADGKLYDHLKRGKSVFWSGDAQRQRSGSAPLTDCSWCRAMCAI
jgi:hypothetical protein